MPFVKVDTAILDSSVWSPRDLRSLFLTALFMAKPFNLKQSTPQLHVRSLEPTGWIVPPGEYGIVEASGTRMVERDGQDLETGLRYLEALGEPDLDTKNPAYDGRRIVRIAGGYLVLNFRLYRDKDYTAATRMRRLRERKKGEDLPAPATETPSRYDVTRNVTQAEAEAEAEVVKTLLDVAEGSAANISTDLPTWGDDSALRLARMVNRGMADNPAIGDTYNPVIGTSGHALQAAEDLKAAGVQVGFAETWIYTLATAYKPRKRGDQINSVGYLVPAVIDKWNAERARIDAAAAPRPSGAETPSPAQNLSRNGSGDAKGRGMLIFGQLREAVEEYTHWNDPNDHGAGNRLGRRIKPEVLAELVDPAAVQALAAIGGERAIANARDLDSLSWRFAAAYQGAANG
jgi:hypothetical protein